MTDVSATAPLANKPAPSGSLAAAAVEGASERALSLPLVGALLGFSEGVALIFLGLVIHWLYEGEILGDAYQYLVSIPVISLAAIAVAVRFGAYRPVQLRTVATGLPLILLTWTIAFLLLLASAFFLRAGSDFSRAWAGLWFLAGALSLAAMRIALSRHLQIWVKAGLLDINAVIVGGGDSATRLIQALETSKTAGIRIVGLFDDRGQERSAVANYSVLGSFDDLVNFARTRRVDLLILALPLTAEARMMQLLKKLWVLPVDVRVSALSSRLRFRPRAYSYIGDVPFLDIFDKPLSPSDVVVKALFDRLVGGLALLLLSPVMAATALAVRLTSPGPVLFRQKRYGFNNELIEVFKFRSMYVDKSDATAAKLVTKNDPRVTPVGRFIRKTSLDELPQLFNVVFKGNLSLVGPRPHAVHAKAADALYQDVVDGYYARHKMKPGITGWAQINGWRGETDTPEKIQRRVECDLHYIENWSILLDAYILAMTPISLVTKADAAY